MALSRLSSKLLRVNPLSRAMSSGGGQDHHAAATKMWRNLSFFVAMPAIGVCMINAYLSEMELHKEPRPEFRPYEHLRRRTKPFPWGDGNHSLFHNDHVNPLPDGYEHEEEHHH